MPALKNVKHEQFARYLAEGIKPSEAITKVGYLPTAGTSTVNVTANKLMRSDEIQKRVAELQDQAAARTSITIARVLDELAKIGFSNPLDYMKIQEDGTAYIDLKDMTRDQAAAISEIQVDEYTEGRGEDARQVKKVKLKFHDKRAALMDIGKHLGMFKDIKVHVGPNGGPIQTENKVEVSLLQKDEREMLKQLLLLAAERKRNANQAIEVDYNRQ
jgi:phage terminase small subunit